MTSPAASVLDVSIDQQAFEALVHKIGRPQARANNWAIYGGDCLEVLPRIPQGAIPLTVTSPPYNIGKEYEEVRSIDEYLEWSQSWIRQVHRVTESDGAFWLNLGFFSLPTRGHAVPIAYLLWDRVPFFLVQEIVWNYGAGVAARNYFSPRNEKFLWYVKDSSDYLFDLDAVRDPDVKYPNQKKNGKLRCNPLGKNPTDVWQIPKVTSGKDRSSIERTPHPAQFPVALVDRIVRACSAVGDIVLDPFAGSGSLLEAAVNAGRFAIGIEIRPDYVTLAADRLRKATAQSMLL